MQGGEGKLRKMKVRSLRLPEDSPVLDDKYSATAY